MTFSESDSTSTRAIFDKIDWSYNNDDILAYRHDCSAQYIKCGAALSVNSGKVVVITYDSETFDIFLPGEYTLNSTTLKKAANIFSQEFAGGEPFTCDVCYVDIMPRENLIWESSDDIWALDKNGQAVRLSGKGSYGFRMSNPEVFLRKVFGREKSLSFEKFTAQLENLIIAGISGVLSEYKVDVSMLREEKEAVVGFIGTKLREKLSEYGFVLIGFSIDEFAVLDDSGSEDPINDIASDNTAAEQIQSADTKNKPTVYEAVIKNKNEAISEASSIQIDGDEQKIADDSSSLTDIGLSLSFEDSRNTIEEFELPEQEETSDIFDFKLDIPDIDLSFLNIDELLSDNGDLAMKEPQAVPENNSDTADSVSELSVDSIPFADEEIIQSGGSIKLDPESIRLMTGNQTGEEIQKNAVQDNLSSELDSIIGLPDEKTDKNGSYSMFASCPKCGKSVLKGMICPECGTKVE